MSFLASRMVGLSSVFFLAFAILVSYVLQIAEANEYLGYRVFPLDSSYFIVLAVIAFIVGILIPVNIVKPSDFFVFLYAIFTLIPYAVLYPIRNSIAFEEFIIFFSALLLPVVVVRLVGVTVAPLRIPGLMTGKWICCFLVLVCLLGVALALAKAPPAAGFTFDYERRIQGRDIYTTGSVLAYLNAAIVNGFGPFLAFFAGWQRKKLLMVTSLFCGLAFFYVLGLKAPVLFILVAYLIGRAASAEKLYLISKTIYSLLFFLFALFFIEYGVFGDSMVGDYFIRRAFSVPAWVMSAFFEFMSVGSGFSWTLLEGTASESPVTFVVGEGFLGLVGLNANTNAFVYELGSDGLFLYLMVILLVSIIFALLDSAYLCRRNPALIYLGFSFSILLTEQAATTALVSSGLGVLIALVLFSEKSNGRVSHPG